MSEHIDRRSATVEIDDRHGFHIVHASGTAGDAWVATRSADIGFSLAVYYATYGELPRADWEVGIDQNGNEQDNVAPWSFSWFGEQEAIEQFRTREIVWTASLRGELSRQAPAADAIMTEADWHALDIGEEVIYPSNVPQGHAVIEDSDGIARIVEIGKEYVNADGSMFTVTQ